jgi:DNA-directed RNA polymerase specialized sigma24 family protein
MNGKQDCRPRPASEAASSLELIARAQQGEEAAFFALYELHKARVHRICLRLAGGTREAESLTQSVFLSAFRKIQAFASDAEFAETVQDLAIRAALALRKQRALAPPLGRRHGTAAKSGRAKVVCSGGNSRRADASASTQSEKRLPQQWLKFSRGPFSLN